MLVAYVYSNKDEEYLDVLDTIEGDDNKEVDELFEDAWVSNDYNYSFVAPRSL